MCCSRKWRVPALLLSIIVTFAGRGFSQTAPPSAQPTPESSDTAQSAPSEEQVRFADQYVKAVNAGDPKALRSLVAPKTLACYNARTEPYLTDWLGRQTKDPISAPYSITVEPYDDSDIHPSALFTLPVVPTQQINISTQIKGKDVILGRPIAYQAGRWYLTAPCPTDMGIDKFISQRDRSAQKAALLDALYAGLKDPMLSDLKKLIRENRIGDACDKYTAAEKLDFKTGCAVVKRLAASMGIVVK